MSGAVVVDASLAVKWVLAEEHSAKADELLSEWGEREIGVIFPLLFAYEVTNILCKRVQRLDITVEVALDNLAELLAIGTQVYDPRDSLRAIALAAQLHLPATYDAHYLALAERLGCELWTADERLRNAVRGHLSWVRWLGEYAAGM